jgi:hypothetical protein
MRRPYEWGVNLYSFLFLDCPTPFLGAPFAERRKS